jgi:hypothetical protein
MEAALKTTVLRCVCVSLLILLFPPIRPARPEAEEPVRVGIIGLDTSHVVEFTKVLNDVSSPDHVPGARVVAAYKGGSPDVEASASRIERFTAQLRDQWKVEIVPAIPALCSKVDAVLLESVDGRVHLEQVKPVLAAKKRVFIDKPLAASVEDAREIARLAREAGVPWFSSSSLRFAPDFRSLRNNPQLDEILGCDAYGPSPTEPHHPDLFWYGIHGVEILFTLMGTGCESVTRVYTPEADVVVGKWKGGRLGTFRGIRAGKRGFGATVFGSDGIGASHPERTGYRPLLVEIVKFFKTGVPPVSPEETLEIFAFMQAAELSKTRKGQDVPLAEVTH